MDAELADKIREKVITQLLQQGLNENGVKTTKGYHYFSYREQVVNSPKSCCREFIPIRYTDKELV